MRFDRNAPVALVIAAATLLAAGIGFRFAARSAEAYFAKEPVPLRRAFSSIPKRLGAWQASGEDQMLTAEVEEALGTDVYLDRTYVRSEGGIGPSAVAVHIAYYTGLIDAVPHVVDRCAVAHGWVNVDLPDNLDFPVDRSQWTQDPERVNRRTGEPYPVLTFRHHVTGRPVTVRMPIGPYQVRTSEFRIGDSPDERLFAGYFFIANGEIMPTPEGVRKFAFALDTKYAYYAKVQFTVPVREGQDRERFVEVVADLARELLPELMACLPDWGELEAELDKSRS